MSENILRVENVTMQFGGVVAVNNLSLDINKGALVALIGPHGAGKTTAFNVVTGVYEPTNGRVSFKGKTIVENHPQGKMKKLYHGENAGVYTHVVSPTPDKITKLGIARTFQNIRLFGKMTVFENVLIARHMRSKANFMSATLRLNHAEEAANREAAMKYLKLVGLEDLQLEKASSLPYGKQRRLEIARALATEPELLLLDEPAAAMEMEAAVRTESLIDEYRRECGCAVLLVTHDLSQARRMADEALFFFRGELREHGKADQVLRHPEKEETRRFLDFYGGRITEG